MDGHFFFVISHEEIHANEAIFQKYKIGDDPKEQNELIFIKEVKI